ncbi:NAD(P)-binding protein [Mollisia scopiformis]|uniref:NAD(P)-binding protein n=1 Tax=Mollisia scopiformis TaxID=149040 RepID=A0A194XUL5_MOLSC|nr:NAD(P)-binding protein [Mollisia scopiformis]KUJ24010.1 NAD(P)-binding protein [Mollisia scopiformis]
MAAIERNPSVFHVLKSKTAIITGGANGIVAEVVRLFHSHGANVVIADLLSTKTAAETLISSLSSRVVFIPTDILTWQSMVSLFNQTVSLFGSVELVVANAGMMESKPYYEFEEDENGDLKEPKESYRVIDVNLKGTMNTLRLAIYYMRKNQPSFADGSKGSVVLISSTSGYFGGTGVVSYVSSKHGVTGLLRSSQRNANRHGVRVNGVAPFFTPTYITSSYSQSWKESGLPANSVQDVAWAFAQTATDLKYKGACILVRAPALLMNTKLMMKAFGSVMKEIEIPRTQLLSMWLGEDVSESSARAGALFESLGGYPLPKPKI